MMENEYCHALSRIEELRDGRSDSIRISAGPIWLAAILPPITAHFQPENPSVDISLFGGVIDTVVPDLLSGKFDIICVSLNFPNRSETAKKPLFDMRHVLIADPLHPLSKKQNVKPADIYGYPWIVLKSDFMGKERTASLFAAHGLSPSYCISNNPNPWLVAGASKWQLCCPPYGADAATGQFDGVEAIPFEQTNLGDLCRVRSPSGCQTICVGPEVHSNAHGPDFGWPQLNFETEQCAALDARRSNNWKLRLETGVSC